jgi:hypothetical protein
MGMIPDPRQIGGGGGGGPPTQIPGKSGIGGGDGPPIVLVGACAEQLHLLVVGSRMSPCLASVAVIEEGGFEEDTAASGFGLGSC